MLTDRDIDLIEKYFQALKLNKNKSLCSMDAVAMAINSEAKRFYISKHEAQRAISKMLKGKTCQKKSKIREKMYNDIFIRFNKWKESNPEKGIGNGIEFVISQPAPRFYLDKTTAYQRICKIIKKRK